jgi:hypothetical protein
MKLIKKLFDKKILSFLLSGTFDKMTGRTRDRKDCE